MWEIRLPLSNWMDGMILGFVMFSYKMVTTLGLCARHLLTILGSIMCIIWSVEGVGVTLSFFWLEDFEFQKS